MKYSELIKGDKTFDDKIEGKEYNHTEYCHYTSLDVIDRIIGGKALMLGRVEKLNDKHDEGQFKKLKETFMLCFATGAHENLPMWQIYSGCKLQGGRVQFNGWAIKRLIEEGKFEIWEEETYQNRLNEPNKKYEPYILKTDEMYKAFHDVVYTERKGKYCNIKYNNSFITEIPKEQFDKYIDSEIDGWHDGHKGFEKDLIWFYEKETRLIVQLKDGVLEKVKKYYREKNEVDKGDYVVSLNFENIYNELKKSSRFQVRLAPCIVSDSTKIDFEDRTVLKRSRNVLKPYKHIKAFIGDTSSLKFSEFSGGIFFKLNCKKINKTKQGGKGQ